VEASIEEIYAWFVDVLNQMDIVELRRSPTRQLKAPRIAIVADDLGETSLLPHLPQTIFTRSDLQSEHLFVRRSLLEDPALEVFKTEISEDLQLRGRSKKNMKLILGM